VGGGVDDKNPFIIALYICRRKEKSHPVSRISQRVPDDDFPVEKFDLNFASGAGDIIAIRILVLFIAVKILGEKNGFKVININPRRLSSGNFQVEKDFVGEKIIGNALYNFMVLIVRNYFISQHSPELLSQRGKGVSFSEGEPILAMRSRQRTEGKR
jgi:hypothetical protein